MKQNAIKILSFIMVLTLILATISLAGCDDTKTDAAPISLSETLANWQAQYTVGSFGINDPTHPFVEISFSTGDAVRVELYPEKAPLTVDNFIKYVKDGYYVGTVFHRIIYGFMVQTGGFILKKGEYIQKTATYGNIKGEFSANGVTTNDILHTKGVISLARTNDYDGGSCQFFICSADSPHLNGQYAAFGKVIDQESMDVISKFEKLETKTIYDDLGRVKMENVPELAVWITKTTLVWDQQQ